jgi:hypothetical protein
MGKFGTRNDAGVIFLSSVCKIICMRYFACLVRFPEGFLSTYH